MLLDKKVLADGVRPVDGENRLQDDRRRTDQAHMRVAPAVEGAAIDMLLADIEPAGIADDIVDDGNLAVVAVADRVEPPEARVGRHLHAAARELPAVRRIHAEERSER